MLNVSMQNTTSCRNDGFLKYSVSLITWSPPNSTPTDSPKNTSVSVEPSMEVDMGSNFTLTCSSQANPPVERYVWFKIHGNEPVEVGSHPVLVSSEEGQFLCRASNKHGSQNSSVVTLTIKSE